MTYNPLNETFWASTNPLAVVLMTAMIVGIGAPSLGYVLAVWMKARRDGYTEDNDEYDWQ